MGAIIDRCRELRKNPTKAEEELWRVIRKLKRKGYKFHRQYPLYVTQLQGHIKYYIADFYCHEARLVIEVDGGYHETIKEEDKNRDEVVAALGLKTIRFKNEEVLNSINSVIKKIEEQLPD